MDLLMGCSEFIQVLQWWMHLITEKQTGWDYFFFLFLSLFSFIPLLAYLTLANILCILWLWWNKVVILSTLFHFSGMSIYSHARKYVHVHTIIKWKIVAFVFVQKVLIFQICLDYIVNYKLMRSPQETSLFKVGLSCKSFIN